jgi:four helix bundle protein
VEHRYSYRTLILWQRAQELAYETIQVTKRLPNTWASAVIARQVIASATSIAADIAEGHGRFSLGAYRNHLSIAHGSAAETDSWLDLLRCEGALTEHKEQHLHEQCRQLLGMLTTKINALETRGAEGKQTLRETGGAYAPESSMALDGLFDEADYSTR